MRYYLEYCRTSIKGYVEYTCAMELSDMNERSITEAIIDVVTTKYVDMVVILSSTA